MRADNLRARARGRSDRQGQSPTSIIAQARGCAPGACRRREPSRLAPTPSSGGPWRRGWRDALAWRLGAGVRSHLLWPLVFPCPKNSAIGSFSGKLGYCAIWRYDDTIEEWEGLLDEDHSLHLLARPRVVGEARRGPRVYQGAWPCHLHRTDAQGGPVMKRCSK
jgi:hypothetical protein